ncbi:(d)CMP kinase [Terriglobus sp. RCC_193]|uniref:(d)CMP kinase n=1 Tax=Terriglobus sp. RCC_193 TaxID=3239218 RepID=UPI0035246E92
MTSAPQNETRRGLIVAIDGPAGAGKSTVAAHLARTFGLLNLETGAMYRALALKALRNKIPVTDGEAVLALTTNTTITLEPGAGGNRVLLDGEDVTAILRNPEVTQAASQVSVHGPVRVWMVNAQRTLGLGAATGVVMEGRDIGTVVFPDADVKIFLDASVEARGDRRFAQQPAAESKENLLNEMRDRDRRDRERTESPLRPAEDAIVLDTTGMTLDQVLERAAAIVANVPRR